MLTDIFKSIVAIIASLSMVLSPVTPSLVHEETTQDTVHYVSLGASNTVGFGLDGYLTDETMADPYFLKDSTNIFGYQCKAPEAYPSLIASAIEDSGKNVVFDQLGMSSMRAEEIRVLTDENYDGDTYTSWRFTNAGGWFDRAGGIDALRAEYRTKLTEADLVTLDIGVNNFGVYASNRLFNNMYQGSDMQSLLTAEEYEDYLSAYNKVKSYIMSVAGDMVPEATLDLMVDTFAYALYGYCTSFDAVVGTIYEWNPDVDIVVVSIQNMMYGLTLDVNGTEVPIGEIYGGIVNMANLYTAVLSPYADKYNYALLSEDGHVSTFLDELLAYDGTVEGVPDCIKDCADIYDNSLYIKMRVKYEFIKQLKSKGIPVTSVNPSYPIDTILASANNFATAYYYDLIQINGISARTLFDTADTDITQLPSAFQPYFTLYLNGLAAVYTGLARCFKYGVEPGVVSLEGLTSPNVSDIEDGLMDDVVFAYATQCLVAGFTGQEVPEFVLPAEYDNATARSIMIMGIRNSIGNSYFIHPSVEGHRQVAEAILNAYRTGITGKDIALFKISAAASEGAEELAEEYGDEALDAVSEAADAVADEVKELVSDIADAVAEEEKQEIADAADKASEEVSQKIEEAADAIGENVPELAEKITDKLADAAEEAAEAFIEDLAESAAAEVDNAEAFVNEAAEKAADDAVQAVEDAAEKVIDAFAAEGDDFGVKIEEAKEAVEEGKQAVIDSAEKTMEAVAEYAEQAPEKAAGAIAEAANEAVKAVVGIDAAEVAKKAGNIAGYIGDAAEKLWNIFAKLAG